MTFNHELYIRDAMNGIMTQETDFLVEVVVGDDFSSDGTLKIIRQYDDSDKIHIRILERTKGDGYRDKRRKLGRLYNFTDIINNCSGEYVALLDGDDYWTDPLKLQKQVDFLENSPDFAICFHRPKLLVDDKNQLQIRHSNRKEVSGFKDLAREGNYIPTATCVFRNNLFESFPDFFYESEMGDWPLHLLNSQHGKVKYLNDLMAVYRIHSGGAWSNKGENRHLRSMIETAQMCKKHFGEENARHFNHYLANLYAEVCFVDFEEGRFKIYKKDFKSAFNYLHRLSFRTSAALVLRYFLCFMPRFGKLFTILE